MTPISDPLAILLVESDPERRAGLAAGLRRDGMKVIEHSSPEAALAALRRGMKAAVMVTEPALGRLTESELFEQVRDTAPRLVVIFTRAAGAGRLAAPQAAYALAQPFDPAKLSRFIRLVAARPALRSALQQQYRRTRSSQQTPMALTS